MRPFIFFLFFLFIASTNLQAQTPYPKKEVEKAPANLESLMGKHIFNQSELIDSLIVWHAKENKKHGGTKGYRLQIYFSSGADARTEIQKTRARFLRERPDINTYTTYNAPDFKLRVGNFRTKSEALKLKKELSSMFPDSFIVPEIIDPKY